MDDDDIMAASPKKQGKKVDTVEGIDKEEQERKAIQAEKSILHKKKEKL